MLCHHSRSWTCTRQVHKFKLHVCILTMSLEAQGAHTTVVYAYTINTLQATGLARQAVLQLVSMLELTVSSPDDKHNFLHLVSVLYHESVKSSPALGQITSCTTSDHATSDNLWLACGLVLVSCHKGCTLCDATVMLGKLTGVSRGEENSCSNYRREDCSAFTCIWQASTPVRACLECEGTCSCHTPNTQANASDCMSYYIQHLVTAAGSLTIVKILKLRTVLHASQ